METVRPTALSFSPTSHSEKPEKKEEKKKKKNGDFAHAENGKSFERRTMDFQDFSFLKPTGVEGGSSLWNFHDGFKSSLSKVNVKKEVMEAEKDKLIPQQFIEVVDEDEDEEIPEAPPKRLQNIDLDLEEEREMPRHIKLEKKVEKKVTKRRRRDDDDEDDMEDDFDEDEFDERQAKSHKNRQFVDITEYLCLPQSDAAVKLGLPVSTLSKRWKESAKNRKWPFRKVTKIDKEIGLLLQGVCQEGEGAGVLSPELEHQIGVLLRERQDELRTVSIRL